MSIRASDLLKYMYHVTSCTCVMWPLEVHVHVSCDLLKYMYMCLELHVCTHLYVYHVTSCTCVMWPWSTFTCSTAHIHIILHIYVSGDVVCCMYMYSSWSHDLSWPQSCLYIAGTQKVWSDVEWATRIPTSEAKFPGIQTNECVAGTPTFDELGAFHKQASHREDTRPSVKLLCYEKYTWVIRLLYMKCFSVAPWVCLDTRCISFGLIECVSRQLLSRTCSSCIDVQCCLQASHPIQL